MKGIRTRPLLALALIAGLSACGSDSSGPDDDRVTIEMRDNTFSPATRTVTAGTTVRWVNEGNVAHNSTGAGNLWVSQNLNPGQSFDRTFPSAGTFEYVCTLHAGMSGTIVVQ